MIVTSRYGWTKRSARFQLFKMRLVVHGATSGRMGLTGLLHIGEEGPGAQPRHECEIETAARVISP